MCRCDIREWNLVARWHSRLHSLHKNSHVYALYSHISTKVVPRKSAVARAAGKAVGTCIIATPPSSAPYVNSRNLRNYTTITSRAQHCGSIETHLSALSYWAISMHDERELPQISFSRCWMEHVPTMRQASQQYGAKLVSIEEASQRFRNYEGKLHKLHSPRCAST
jgi:hypothetical protein